MNFELRTTGNASPRSTTVTLEGQDIGDRAFNIELAIPANGLAMLKIYSHETDADGNILLGGEGDKRHLLIKTVSYTGSFTITGDVKQLLEPVDGY